MVPPVEDDAALAVVLEAAEVRATLAFADLNALAATGAGFPERPSPPVKAGGLDAVLDAHGRWVGAASVLADGVMVAAAAQKKPESAASASTPVLRTQMLLCDQSLAPLP